MTLPAQRHLARFAYQPAGGRRVFAALCCPPDEGPSERRLARQTLQPATGKRVFAYNCCGDVVEEDAYLSKDTRLVGANGRRIFATACCPGGSGSGSGSGRRRRPRPLSSCCDDARTRYYVTITPINRCECLEGIVFPIDLIDEIREGPEGESLFVRTWEGRTTVPCHGGTEFFKLRLICLVATDGSNGYRIFYYCGSEEIPFSDIDGPGVGGIPMWPDTPAIHSCDPFYLRWTVPVGTCCYTDFTIGGTVILEITE